MGIISPIELTLLAVLAGFISIASLNNDELNVLGNWLIGVGGLMVVAATQASYIDNLQDKKNNEDILNKQILLLREEIKSHSGRHSSKL